MRALLTLSVFLVLAVSTTSAQWQKIDQNLGIQTTYQARLAAADNNYLYQTVLVGPPFEMAFFRSSDDGSTWQRISTFPGQAIIPKFFRVLANGRLVMGSPDAAMTMAVILYSDDQGATWQQSTTTAGIDVRTVEWLGGDVYMAGIASGKPIKSTNGGVDWSLVETGPNDVNQIRAVGSSLVAIAAGGIVHRSPDAGALWLSVTVDPQAPAPLNTGTSIWTAGNAILIKRSGGPIFASTDGGVTWSARSSPLGDLAYMTVETSPDGKAWLFWTLNAIYLSTDVGQTAVDIAAGHPRESGATFCVGDYTLTNTALHMAAVCNFAPDNTGMYRYSFSAPSSVGADVADAEAGLDLRVTPSDGVWRLEFTVPASTGVRITVHDESGDHVATVLDGDYDAGTHAARYDADVLPSGVYWLRMESEGRSVTKKMVEVR